jgi:hypothetical protein
MLYGDGFHQQIYIIEKYISHLTVYTITYISAESQHSKPLQCDGSVAVT